MTDHIDPIPFSRAIIGGKKTEKVDARVSDELKEGVRRKWMDNGFTSESEYVEYVLAVDVFGKAHVRSVLQERFRGVFSLSDSRQTNGDGAQQ